MRFFERLGSWVLYGSTPKTTPKKKPAAVKGTLEYLNETCKCPDCDSPNFIIGPSGGMAVNIECAGCGNFFWFGPPFTPERLTGLSDEVKNTAYRSQPVNLWDEVYGKNTYTGI